MTRFLSAMSLVMVRLGRPRTAGRCLGAAGHGRAGGRGGAGLAVPRLFFVVLQTNKSTDFSEKEKNCST